MSFLLFSEERQFDLKTACFSTILGRVGRGRMAICYFCNGSGRCAGCGGTGVQADGRTCALCGGDGRCQHCTGGVMRAGVGDQLHWGYQRTSEQHRRSARRAGRSERKRSASVARVLGATLGTALPGLVAGGAAHAQSLPTYTPINQRVCSVFDPQCPGGAGGNSAQSTSSEEKVVFNTPTTRTTNTTIYATEIIGRLNGGTPLYDHTFSVPYSDAAAQGGVVAARAAITTAGGPGVIIGAPVLTASSTTTATSSTTLYSLAGTSTSTAAVVTVGPSQSPIQIGTRSTCTGISGLPGTTAPSCTAVAPVAQYTASLPGFNINFRQSGNLAPNGALILNGNNQIVFQDPTAVKLTVSGGVILTNFDIVTTYTIDQATTTTSTTTQFEQYTLFGVVRAIGTAHPAMQVVALDASDIFLSRLLGPGKAAIGAPVMVDGKPSRWSVFLEGTGYWGRIGATASLPGSTYSFGGVRGGLGYTVTPDLSVGFAAEGGRTTWSMSDATSRDSASGDGFRAGAFALYSPGAWRFSAAAFAGRQHFDTNSSWVGISDATTASFDATTYGAGVTAGYAFNLGGVTLTPRAGLSWLGWNSPSYAESGGLLPLSVESATRNQVRPSLGLTAEHSFAIDNGQALSLGASVKGFAVLGDHDGSVRATAAGFSSPGSFGIEAPGLGRYGVELGGYGALALSATTALTASYSGRIMGHGGITHGGQIGLKVAF